MRRLCLRKAAVRLLLSGVSQVWKFDRVLDEEHRDVVADDVPIALLGVELDGEAAHVAREVGRALVAGDSREPHEGFGLLARPLEQIGLADVGERFARLEEAMSPEAAGVHDALGDSLMVEMEDLLAEVVVLQQGRTAPANLQ